jgi:tRNA-2-methylthio-N6-dimethylallyladenosine synthase
MSHENKVIDESMQGEATMLNDSEDATGKKKLFIESYGCQMNFSDSEVVASIMKNDGYATTRNVDEADVVLINTCSIRENAETRVRNRLTEFKKKKEDNPELVVGILGCMAERLKKNLLEEEKLVDLVDETIGIRSGFYRMVSLRKFDTTSPQICVYYKKN